MKILSMSILAASICVASVNVHAAEPIRFKKGAPNITISAKSIEHKTAAKFKVNDFSWESSNDNDEKIQTMMDFAQSIYLIEKAPYFEISEYNIYEKIPGDLGPLCDLTGYGRFWPNAYNYEITVTKHGCEVQTS